MKHKMLEQASLLPKTLEVAPLPKLEVPSLDDELMHYD